jgi:fructose-specific phosphotransferase system IIC component
MALLISLAFALHGIIQKHKGKPNAYKRIFQEIGIFIITLLLVILLGGLAGAFVNGYVSSLYAEIIGLVFGLITAFAVGYELNVEQENFFVSKCLLLFRLHQLIQNHWLLFPFKRNFS